MVGYHVAESEARASIRALGLDCQIAPKESESSGNWLWPQRVLAESFAGPESDIWQANLDGLDVSHEYMNGRIALSTYEPLGPERLTLVRAGHQA
jgi:hypothetical protein